MSELLLVSNSQSHGGGYLAHFAAEMIGLLGSRRRVLFIPFALQDRQAYAARFRRRLEGMGLESDALTDQPDAAAAVEQAQAIFTGGGNTFRLLDALERLDVLPAIRERVRRGMPYIGTSAGANLAGATIMTTNDMPIVQPRSFDALGLVPFQLNCHYLNTEPGSTHMGETRETRLREFHEMNATPVVALREGAWLRVSGGSVSVGGKTGGRLFLKGQPPQDLTSGSSLDHLLPAA